MTNSNQQRQNTSDSSHTDKANDTNRKAENDSTNRAQQPALKRTVLPLAEAVEAAMRRTG